MHVSGLAEMTEEMGNSYGKQQLSADGGGHPHSCYTANVILTVKIWRLYVTAHLYTVCKNKWHLLLEPTLSSMLGLINGFQ